MQTSVDREAPPRTSFKKFLESFCKVRANFDVSANVKPFYGLTCSNSPASHLATFGSSLNCERDARHNFHRLYSMIIFPVFNYCFPFN